jgi:ABC-type xylose transport system permease subunit
MIEDFLQKRDPSIPPNSQLVAHAALCSIGFMILLPLGAIIGRYRTLNPFWFNIHAAVQMLAGLLIIPGFALGVHFNNKLKALGTPGDPVITSSQHNNTGMALFALYIVQVIVGVVIHQFKQRDVVHRPPQNYFHAILGLVIISLAMWQVHDGYHKEYLIWGATVLPTGVNKAYIAMVVILTTIYVAGLALLPTQYKAESERAKLARGNEALPMSSVDANA